MSRIRIGAVGDLHCRKSSGGTLPFLASVNQQADVLLLCGDLTDYGLIEEAEVLARELSVVRVPIIAVLGNHDYESGHAEDVKHILSEVRVQVLDGTSCEARGVGIAGIKGFCGGYGRATLGYWGEPGVKQFVQYAIDEELKLETALGSLKTAQRVVIMHYSPIRGTCEGEPAEIFPYLGCGRLEEPLIRFSVAAVFHGHAHKGSPEGRTSNGETPVYNVALPLMLRLQPGRSPIKIVELDVDEGQPFASGEQPAQPEKPN